MVEDKIEGSLDIEYIPKRETREYSVKSGSFYTQTKQYDKQGNLEKEIWERESLGGEIILDDAAYISKEKFEELQAESKLQSYKPADLMRLAKREEYTGNDGLIYMIYHGKIHFSSDVIKIEPPFGAEYIIDA